MYGQMRQAKPVFNFKKGIERRNSYDYDVRNMKKSMRDFW